MLLFSPIALLALAQHVRDSTSFPDLFAASNADIDLVWSRTLLYLGCDGRSFDSLFRFHFIARAAQSAAFSPICTSFVAVFWICGGPANRLPVITARSTPSLSAMCGWF